VDRPTSFEKELGKEIYVKNEGLAMLSNPGTPGVGVSCPKQDT
jgi:hypothetical protein